MSSVGERAMMAGHGRMAAQQNHKLSLESKREKLFLFRRALSKYRFDFSLREEEYLSD
jgi:hypothetical protein